MNWGWMNVMGRSSEYGQRGSSAKIEYFWRSKSNWKMCSCKAVLAECGQCILQ